MPIEGLVQIFSLAFVFVTVIRIPAVAAVCSNGTFTGALGLCVPCPPGHYCPNGANTYPTRCPADHFSTAVGATNNTTCVSCPAGLITRAGGTMLTDCQPSDRLMVYFVNPSTYERVWTSTSESSIDGYPGTCAWPVATYSMSSVKPNELIVQTWDGIRYTNVDTQYMGTYTPDPASVYAIGPDGVATTSYNSQFMLYSIGLYNYLGEINSDAKTIRWFLRLGNGQAPTLTSADDGYNGNCKVAVGTVVSSSTHPNSFWTAHVTADGAYHLVRRIDHNMTDIRITTLWNRAIASQNFQINTLAMFNGYLILSFQDKLTPFYVHQFTIDQCTASPPWTLADDFSPSTTTAFWNDINSRSMAVVCTHNARYCTAGGNNFLWYDSITKKAGPDINCGASLCTTRAFGFTFYESDPWKLQIQDARVSTTEYILVKQVAYADCLANEFKHSLGSRNVMCMPCVANSSSAPAAVGEAACVCDPGFEKDNATLTTYGFEMCVNINECAHGLDNCDLQATCTDTEASFGCTCNTGYSGTGVTCANVDECSSNIDDCASDATCTDTPGSFTCACNTGYSGSGTTCANINECSSGIDNCASDATCTDNTGSFTCACNLGYTGNGITCTNINECTNGTHGCGEAGVCTDTAGSFTCSCPPGTWKSSMDACSVCPLGHYCAGTDATYPTRCAGGSYSNVTGATSSAVCVACPAGTYAMGGGRMLTDCQPATRRMMFEQTASTQRVWASTSDDNIDGGPGTYSFAGPWNAMPSKNANEVFFEVFNWGAYESTVVGGPRYANLDTLYIGTYTTAVDSVYDPPRPFRFGISHDREYFVMSPYTENYVYVGRINYVNHTVNWFARAGNGLAPVGTTADDGYNENCRAGFTYIVPTSSVANRTWGFTHVGTTTTAIRQIDYNHDTVRVSTLWSRVYVYDNYQIEALTEFNGYFIIHMSRFVYPAYYRAYFVDIYSATQPWGNGYIWPSPTLRGYTGDTFRSSFGVCASNFRACIVGSGYIRNVDVYNGITSQIRCGSSCGVRNFGAAWFESSPWKMFLSDFVVTGESYIMVKDIYYADCVAGEFRFGSGRDLMCMPCVALSTSAAAAVGQDACVCNAGYEKSFDELSEYGFRTCVNVNECTLLTDNCDTNAVCADTTGSFTCTCNLGYSGTGVTCTNIDECVQQTDNCADGATCMDNPGSFTCACLPGFNGDGVTCINVDECTSNTHNCDMQASCADTTGSFTCACNAGFGGNGVVCSNLDECTLHTHNCAASAECGDTDGSFTCVCTPGFTGNGTVCALCEANHWCTAGMQYSCAQNAVSQPGSGIQKNCSCLPGYYGEFGGMCFECLVDHWCPGGDALNPCAANSTSLHVSSNASSDCICDPGFEKVNETSAGPVCELCMPNTYCASGALHLCPDSNMRSPWGSGDESQCACRAGFFENVSTPVRECVLCPQDYFCLGGVHLEPCFEHAVTPPGANHSEGCICFRGYYENVTGNCAVCPAGSWCWSGVRNDCPLHSTSLPGLSWPQNCSCVDGWEGEPGSMCFNVNECLLGTDNCHSLARCTDTSGSFQCTCNAGYAGDGSDNCTNVDECIVRAGDVCNRNATCLQSSGSFTCNCETVFVSSGTVLVLDSFDFEAEENATTPRVAVALHSGVSPTHTFQPFTRPYGPAPATSGVFRYGTDTLSTFVVFPYPFNSSESSLIFKTGNDFMAGYVGVVGTRIKIQAGNSDYPMTPEGPDQQWTAYCEPDMAPFFDGGVHRLEWLFDGVDDKVALWVDNIRVCLDFPASGFKVSNYYSAYTWGNVLYGTFIVDSIIPVGCSAVPFQGALGELVVWDNTATSVTRDNMPRTQETIWGLWAASLEKNLQFRPWNVPGGAGFTVAFFVRLFDSECGVPSTPEADFAKFMTVSRMAARTKGGDGTQLISTAFVDIHFDLILHLLVFMTRTETVSLAVPPNEWMSVTLQFHRAENQLHVFVGTKNVSFFANWTEYVEYAAGDSGNATVFVETFPACGALDEMHIIADLPDDTESFQCDVHSHCVDTVGSFACACNTGFEPHPFADLLCSAVNECLYGTHNCDDYGATCTDTKYSFECTCNTGFDGDGILCFDEDQCVKHTHHCDLRESVCVNEDYLYSCSCNAGFVGDGLTRHVCALSDFGNLTSEAACLTESFAAAVFFNDFETQTNRALMPLQRLSTQPSHVIETLGDISNAILRTRRGNDAFLAMVRFPDIEVASSTSMMIWNDGDNFVGAYVGLVGTNIKIQAGTSQFAMTPSTPDASAYTAYCETNISQFFDHDLHILAWMINGEFNSVGLWIDGIQVCTDDALDGSNGYYANYEVSGYGIHQSWDKVPVGCSTNSFSGQLGPLYIWEDLNKYSPRLIWEVDTSVFLEDDPELILLGQEYFAIAATLFSHPIPVTMDFSIDFYVQVYWPEGPVTTRPFMEIKLFATDFQPASSSDVTVREVTLAEVVIDGYAPTMTVQGVSVPFALRQWHHVTLSRRSGQLVFFMNGVWVDTVSPQDSDAGVLNGSVVLEMYAEDFVYVDNLRIIDDDDTVAALTDTCGNDNECTAARHSCTGNTRCIDTYGSFYCEDCPPGLNLWEYVYTSANNQFCHIGCKPGAVKTAVAAADLQQASQIVAYPLDITVARPAPYACLAVSASDLQQEGFRVEIDHVNETHWSLTGSIAKPSEAGIVVFAWNYALDPLQTLLDGPNNPCVLQKNSLCSLFDLNRRYTVGDQLLDLAQFSQTDCAGNFSAEAELQQWARQTLRCGGNIDIDDLQWQSTWDQSCSHAEASIVMPLSTVSTTGIPQCSKQADASSDTCRLAFGAVIMQYLPSSGSEQFTVLQVTQQRVDVHYSRFSVATVLTKQSLSCIEDVHASLWRASGDALQLSIMLVLAAGANASSFEQWRNDTELDLITASTQGSDTLMLGPLQMHAVSNRLLVLTATVNASVLSIGVDSLSGTLYEARFSLQAGTCQEVVRVRGGLSNSLPDSTSLDARRSNSGNLTVSNLEVRVLPLQDESGLSALLVSSVSLNSSASVLLQLHVAQVRGCNSTVLSDVQGNAEEVHSLRLACARYPRMCLVSTAVVVGRQLAQTNGWVLLHAEVCPQNLAEYNKTLAFVQRATGHTSRWGTLLIAQYLARLCAEASLSAAVVHLVAARKLTWPPVAATDPSHGPAADCIVLGGHVAKEWVEG